MRYRYIGCFFGITVFMAWMGLWLFSGCASITTPPGGKKDTLAPKLLLADPPNKSLNIRPKKIELRFDEFITVSDVSKEVQISPILSIDPAVTGLYKKVTIKIADTLLEDNTTYRISFGKSIKDLHEGNVYKNFTYTFSTGGYFDSLALSGSVIIANTGLPDTGEVTVVLYNAADIDSCIVRHKPKYVTKTDKNGKFTFRGLPKKVYKIFAIKETNGNLYYDGPPELIAFNDTVVRTGDTSQKSIALRLFREPDDTSIKKVDTTAAAKGLNKKLVIESIKYVVNADTTNPKKRTFDINNRIWLTFNQLPAINASRISLSYDSMGTLYSVPDTIITDTAHPKRIMIGTPWMMNTQYTLKLMKGFAKDTAGAEAPPGKYTFRTFKEEDYGKITIHLPAKYVNPMYVLQVTNENDTIYQQPVTDSMVNLSQLHPAKYSFRIIVDKNRNGKWDSGNLFGKLQPEEVIPYRETLNLKAGWENIIDFEQKPEPPKTPPVNKDKNKNKNH